MTKGRKPLAADVVDVTEAHIDQDKINGAMTAMRANASELALATAQHDSAVRAVAQQLGYQLPADCCDPDLIQRDIAMNMRRSVEACLEVGRGLRVLKEACQHGEFAARLDVLGIDKYVASRFMQSAAKFAKLPSNATLKAIGNQTKLFEMLVLDDEQIEELELTGQTGELKLDDVASMSVKELRAALRELRAEHGAAEEVRAGLHKRIDKLEREKQRIERIQPDEALEALMKEAAAITRDAIGAVRGNLRQAIRSIAVHYVNKGGACPDVFMAGLVGQVHAELNALREEFNLPDVSTAADQQLAAEVAAWSKD